MFCGTGSFKHVDEDPAERAISGGSPKARRKHGGGRANPYAARGLDKFSTVLSELESRRDKILRRVGSDTGLVMVRFVQSNGGWEPIVVKLPVEQQLNDVASAKKPKASTAAASAQTASSSTPPDPASPTEGAAKNAAAARPKAPVRRPASFSWGRMRRPAYYLPAVTLLTLLSLAVFGRVFAVCCTSIWWYLVPTLSSGCSNGAGGDARQAGQRRSMEKRRVASPPPPPQHAEKGSSCGVHEAVSSPRSHAKGRKG